MAENTVLLTVGFLHPGSMGAAVGAQLRPNVKSVVWCPEGRSRSTQDRADAAGFIPIGDLGRMVEQCDVVVSLCPPASAEDVAAAVGAREFTGLYIDANAVSPERVTRMSQSVTAGGARFIDASVVGSPPTGSKRTTLYTSGAPADTALVEALFMGTSVEVRSLDGGVGQASALKLAFTSYQKSARVLAAVAHALAAAHGLEDELLAIADKHRTNYLADYDYIAKTASRAWRWAPELQEVAAMLRVDGLPAGMLDAGAEVLSCWEGLKDEQVTVADAVSLLRQTKAPSPGQPSGTTPG